MKGSWLFCVENVVFIYKLFSLQVYNPLKSFGEKRQQRNGPVVLGSVLEPFLKSAHKLAILQESGKVEVVIDRFIICVMGGANNSAPPLMKMPGSLSIPVALFLLVL